MTIFAYVPRSFILCFLALTTIGVSGQRVTDRNSNLWVSHWGDHRIHARWSFHTEAHWRRADMGSDWQQLLLRPAVNYHLNDAVMATAGYSYYSNYPYGEHPSAFRTWEHQAWEQLQLSQSIGRIRVHHRYRIEQRAIAIVGPDPTHASIGALDRYAYQNRFRYRVWATLPIASEKVVPGVFSANIYDEVFLSFGSSERIDFIQQNRISALLGYQVNSHTSMLLGYLLQHIERPAAVNGSDLLEANSTLHLAVVMNLDLRKKLAPTD